MYKTRAIPSPLLMRFCTLSAHSTLVSLAALLVPLWVVGKKVVATPPPDPVFRVPVPLRVHLWKPCTTLCPSIHRDLGPLSTLAPTTTTTTRNISTFTLFSRSISPGQIFALICAHPRSPHPNPDIPRRPRHALNTTRCPLKFTGPRTRTTPLPPPRIRVLLASETRGKPNHVAYHPHEPGRGICRRARARESLHRVYRRHHP